MNGHLTDAFIGEVTVSEAYLLDDGTAVSNGLGYVVVDVLETGHGDGFKIGTVSDDSFDQGRGELHM